MSRIIRWDENLPDKSPSYPDEKIARKVRAFASYRYLKGSGLEIGGLHEPLEVYHGATVKYVDRLSTEQLHAAYPAVAGQRQVQVDRIDEAETLQSFTDSSQDFVVANHVLEHCRNPIGALTNMLRVVRPGGILFLAVPDKRYSFDVERPVTTYEHVKRDYVEGPDWSDREHYEEWVRLVLKSGANISQERIERLRADYANIHFHAWTQTELIALLLNLQQDFGLQFEVEMIAKNGLELVMVLRKFEEKPN
jgi:predicted SAM-dependent methyltransferase